MQLVTLSSFRLKMTNWQLREVSEKQISKEVDEYPKAAQATKEYTETEYNFPT